MKKLGMFSIKVKLREIIKPILSIKSKCKMKGMNETIYDFVVRKNQILTSFPLSH